MATQTTTTTTTTTTTVPAIQGEYDVCISFDMTCSMSPCMYQVREELDRFLGNIHRELPTARLSIITHGDYDSKRYLTRHMDFTNDAEAVQRYVRSVEDAGSNCWNEGEAYEKALNVAKGLSWAPNSQKIMVVIGDDIPHKPIFTGNTENLDWQKELEDLHDMGISTYGVHAPTLSRERAHFFYSALSEKSLNGQIIPLNQFVYIVDILLALIYRQQGKESVQDFEKQLEVDNRYNRNMEIVFNHLLERTDENKMGHSFPAPPASRRSSSSRSGGGGSANPVFSDLTADDLVAIPPTRFQILNVQADQSIKQFILNTGATFVAGKGYYELSKSEKISQKKGVVLQHVRSGEFFSGNAARALLGLPTSGTGTYTKKPQDVPDGYVAFIQSTSYNRKLKGGTRFLYDTQ